MAKKTSDASVGKEHIARDWSDDPIVRRYQEFAFGYAEGDAVTFVDQVYFWLPWVKAAEQAINDAIGHPAGARSEHSAKIVGTTRAGKTAFHRAMLRERLPSRDHSGLHIPYGYTDMSAVPSPSSIDASILEALGDPTANAPRNHPKRLSRIADMAASVGLEALAVDNVQHLVDSRGERVQHAAVDRLKEIADRIRVPIVFSGLQRMERVFRANEQGLGRTESTIEFRRIDWNKDTEREIFREIIKGLFKRFQECFGPPKFSADDDADLFRLYVAVGGLVGYLIRVMRVAVVRCKRCKSALTHEVLRHSVAKIVGKASDWPGGIDPFHERFVASVSPEGLRLAATIGAGEGPSAAADRSKK